MPVSLMLQTERRPTSLGLRARRTNELSLDVNPRPEAGAQNDFNSLVIGDLILVCCHQLGGGYLENRSVYFLAKVICGNDDGMKALPALCQNIRVRYFDKAFLEARHCIALSGEKSAKRRALHAFQLQCSIRKQQYPFRHGDLRNHME